MILLIAFGILVYTAIVMGIIMDWTTFEHFNPFYNYKQWEEFNWFGVFVGTLFINLFFLPISIIFWFIKLCKVGRK